MLDIGLHQHKLQYMPRIKALPPQPKTHYINLAALITMLDGGLHESMYDVAC